MSRNHLLIPGWSSGEVSPLLIARSDVQAHASGAAAIQNFYPTPQGPVIRRPGTRFVCTTELDEQRLIPFVYSRADNYLLLFEANTGAGQVRLIRDGGLVLRNGEIFRISSPYLRRLDKLRAAQINDKLALVHPDHPPRFLVRRGHYDWAFEEIVTGDGPYAPRRPGEIGVQVAPDAQPGRISLTTDHPLFDVEWIGRPFRLETRWVRIVAVGSPTTAWADTTLPDALDEAAARTSLKNLRKAADAGDPPDRWPAAPWLDHIYRLAHPAPGVDPITPAPSIPTPILDWRAPAWTPSRGYPTCLLWRSQRLWFAATKAEPVTIWSSVVGDLTCFRPGANDDDAVTMTLDASQDAILWLTDDRALIAASANMIWAIAGASVGGPITPSAVTIRSQSEWGATAAEPIPLDLGCAFIERNRKRLRRLHYAWDADAYKGVDLIVMAEHIGRANLRQAVITRGRDALLWTLDDAGALAAMNWEPSQQVQAWSRHPTAGCVRSLANLPSGDGDQLHMVVDRNNNRRCIERVPDRRDAEVTQPWDWDVLDSALSYRGMTTPTLGGLAHLDGLAVEALTEFGHETGLIVRDGAVRLSAPAAWAVVGLPFESRLTTLPIAAGAADGTAAFRPKRLLRARLALDTSIGGLFGQIAQGDEAERLDPIPSRRAGVVAGTLPDLFGGVVDVIPPQGWSTGGRLSVLQRQPYPFTLIAITAQMEIGDGQ